MRHALVLNKKIRILVTADTAEEAVRKALQAEEEGEHLVQWIDSPPRVETVKAEPSQQLSRDS